MSKHHTQHGNMRCAARALHKSKTRTQNKRQGERLTDKRYIDAAHIVCGGTNTSTKPDMLQTLCNVRSLLRYDQHAPCTARTTTSVLRCAYMSQSPKSVMERLVCTRACDTTCIVVLRKMSFQRHHTASGAFTLRGKLALRLKMFKIGSGRKR